MSTTSTEWIFDCDEPSVTTESDLDRGERGGRLVVEKKASSLIEPCLTIDSSSRLYIPHNAFWTRDISCFYAAFVASSSERPPSVTDSWKILCDGWTDVPIDIVDMATCPFGLKPKETGEYLHLSLTIIGCILRANYAHASKWYKTKTRGIARRSLQVD